jgi:hypothetical protein
MKVFYITLLLLLINYEAKSQLDLNNISKNLLYLEAQGIGGYGSLNYERIIPIKEKLKIGARIGLSTYNLTDYTAKFNPDIIIPIAIAGLYGNNHKIVFGFGQTISNIVKVNHSNWKVERETNLHANFTIGYRYQKDKGGIMFSCIYTPIREFYKSYRHSAGISIGYAFKSEK